MTTKAPDILTAALGHMQDRAATYDKPEGERSMPATVAAFNAITGLALTTEQGWLFALLLKAVRSQQGGFKQDTYEDGAAYFALMGEQAAADRGFGDKLIQACQQVNEQMATEKEHTPVCCAKGHGPHTPGCMLRGPGRATHRWSESNQLAYFSRSDVPGWCVWQGTEWVWVGPHVKGEMLPL